MDDPGTAVLPPRDAAAPAAGTAARWPRLLGAAVALLMAAMWALAALDARSVRPAVDGPVVEGIGPRAALLAVLLLLGGGAVLLGGRAPTRARVAGGLTALALVLSAAQLTGMPEVGPGELGGWLAWQYAGAALLLLAALRPGSPATPRTGSWLVQLVARVAAGVPLLVLLTLTVASARREGLVGVGVEDESAWDFDLPLLLIATPLLALLAGARGRWWEPVAAVAVVVVAAGVWWVGVG